MTQLDKLMLGIALRLRTHTDRITYSLVKESRSGNSADYILLTNNHDGRLIDCCNTYVPNARGINLAKYLGGKIISDCSQWRIQLKPEKFLTPRQQNERLFLPLTQLPVPNLTAMDLVKWSANPTIDVDIIYPFTIGELC